MNDWIYNMLYSGNYVWIYILVTLYFAVIYAVLTTVFNSAITFLSKNDYLDMVSVRALRPRQKLSEIQHSCIAILMFGFSGVWTVWAIRTDFLILVPFTWLELVLDLVLLTIWNEIHFFSIHRLMHQRWWMRHVHYVHHTSIVPTVYTVYSLHWFEALLLSTVIVTAAPFLSMTLPGIVLFPLVSLVINLCGHSNMRLAFLKKNKSGMSTAHTAHHTRSGGHLGFGTDLIEKLFGTRAQKG